jgi:hypothetical protein
MDFIARQRQVTCAWHLHQVKSWLRFDRDRHLGNILAYAAYELRCAIERCLFELLVFMKDLKLSKEEEKKCNSWAGLTSLMNEASRSYKEYQKRVVFTNIAVRVMRMPVPPVNPVNIAFLRDSWQKVSIYCHMQLRPEETFNDKEWVERGFAEIAKTLAEFERIYKDSFGIGDISSMPPEVRELYQDFVADRVDQRQVEARLRLMEPVLSQRQWLNNQ